MIDFITFWGTYPDAEFAKSVVSNLPGLTLKEVELLIEEMTNADILSIAIKKWGRILFYFK